MSNILSYGISIPRYWIENSVLHPQQGKKKGKRAIIFSDEDIITLTFAAASECLEKYSEKFHSTFNTFRIDAVIFASSTPIFKNKYHASFLADMLELPNGILALDFSASPRSGSDALLLADKLLETNDYQKILVVAADTYFPTIGNELITTGREGHAGCALLLGKENGIASIIRSKTYSNAIAEEFMYFDHAIQLDSRFSRDAGFMTSVGLAMKDFMSCNEIKPSDINSVILNSIYSKNAVGLFKKAGFDIEKQLFVDKIQSHIGYAGVSHALLLLIDSLQKNSGSILFLDYYNGTNIFLIKQTEEFSIDTQSIESQIKSGSPIENYQDYLMLEKFGNINSPMRDTQEIFSSDIMLEREKGTITHLKGQVCEQCGTVYFIKAQRCNACGSMNFSTRKLSTHGTVFTFTQEHYFPAAFPPVTMAVIDLDGGGRITVQMTDDMYPVKMSESFIGAKVKLVLRKMIENDIKPNYFWKGTLIN